LVALQRAFGARQPTVAEGRDMGTVVFPNARCKIFLDASLDERTRRRAQDLEAKGIAVEFDALREEIRIRDEMASTRTASPLRCAEDAIIVDTTSMTIDAVIDLIVVLARGRV
jgi:cytidylate kinase